MAVHAMSAAPGSHRNVFVGLKRALLGPKCRVVPPRSCASQPVQGAGTKLGEPVSQGEISTLLRDRVPTRTIAYPIAASAFHQALDGVIALDHIGLFFLYDSAAQVSYYDPAKSQSEQYPVLVVRRGLPELTASFFVGDLADDSEARSILVFPVKARMKAKVGQALKQQGIRPLVRWFQAKCAPDQVQRPLVLIYDQPGDRILAKFAEEWSGPEVDRYYY